jgi:hypothetical protein
MAYVTLGTASIHTFFMKEISSDYRLNLGNACYHSLHNILSSHMLSKNKEIKIFLLFYMGVKLGLLS